MFQGLAVRSSASQKETMNNIKALFKICLYISEGIINEGKFLGPIGICNCGIPHSCNKFDLISSIAERSRGNDQLLALERLWSNNTQVLLNQNLLAILDVNLGIVKLPGFSV